MTREENNVKKIILDKASGLFIKYGINAVRTEDISRLSGISKRTLYVHFKSKVDLVQDVIALQTDLARYESEGICTEQTCALEQFTALWNYAHGFIRVRPWGEIPPGYSAAGDT